MNDETLVRRFSQKPGFVLSAYRRVAIPVFRVTVRILTLSRKDLPPIPEYLLKAIQVDVNTPDEIAAFLGLEPRVAHAGLQTLLHSDDIMVSAPESEHSHRLMLTAKGRETLSHLRMVAPEEMVLQMDLDGLTRRAITPSLGPRALKPNVVRREGLIEVRSHPKKNPDFDEVASEARRVFEDTVRGREKAQLDLIDVLSVERIERLFREDALQLFFQPSDGGDLRVEFVVDERLSEEHGVAFSKAAKSSQVRLVPDLSGAADEMLDQLMHSVPLPRAEAERTGQLRQQADEAFQAITAITGRLEETGSVTERSHLRCELLKAQERLQELEASLNAIPVHQVEVYDHSRYLNEALANASRRLMIISPWIKASVVNDAFIKKLEAVLSRGVTVYIGYGLDGEVKRETDRDEAVIARLERLQKRFPHFRFVRFGDTHAKILLCDDWYVMTSFNWLSFRGDPYLPFRDERGTYVRLPDKADEVFYSYTTRYF